jgi:flagellar basal body-associated protein FliL
MTRVEKAILQEEENKKKEQSKKRNDFIFKIISITVVIGIIVALIIYGYLRYQENDAPSKSIAEQVGNIVESPNNKKDW